jgi:phenylacetate-CoA ligase
MRLSKAPDKRSLDAIETASRDEIIVLQTRRLAATLRQTYDAVPAMRAKFDRHGVHPADFRTPAAPVEFLGAYRHSRAQLV